MAVRTNPEEARTALRRRMLDHQLNPLPRHCKSCSGELAEPEPHQWRHADPFATCDEPRPTWQCHACGNEDHIVETSPATVRTVCLEPGCGRYDEHNLDAVTVGLDADRLWQYLTVARTARIQARRDFWGE